MGKVTKKILKNREKWLENRNKFIGGSDAASILGMNPYMSNVALWEIKTGKVTALDISDKPYVRFGTEAEKHIRGLFALMYPEYRVNYQENNSFSNSDYPWAAASLDGELEEVSTGRRGILEIKTSNIMNPSQRDKWKEQIPDTYYCQILHYFMVTGFDFADLIALLRYEIYDDAEIRHYHIERKDVLDDIRYLTRKEKEFWNMVVTNTRPALILPGI